MEFGTLRIANFLSFGKEQTLDLRRRGLVLVTGDNRDDPSTDSNGSGKTAIFDALTWCLWGQTLRGYRADEVVNHRSGRDCAVGLGLLAEDGTEYTVARYRKHRKHKNELWLKIGRKDRRGSSVADTQEKVNLLLGMDFDTFTATVMFGQGSGKRFSELTDAGQKGLLEQVCDLDVLTDALTDVKDRLNTARAERGAAGSEILRAGEALEEADAQLVDLRRTESEFQARQAERLREIDERVEKVDGEVSKLRAEHSTLPDAEVDVAQKQGGLDKLETEHRGLADERSALDDKVRGLRDPLVSDLAQARTQAEWWRGEAEALRSLKSGTRCPTCKEVVSPENLAEHVYEWEATAEEATEETTRLELRLGTLDRVAREQRDATTERGRTLLAEIQNLQPLLDAAKKERDRLAAIPDQTDRLDADLATLRSDRERVEAEKPGVAGTIQATLARLREGRQRRADAVLRRTRAAIDEDHLAWLLVMLGNKGVKSYVLDGVVPFLNRRFAEAAEPLTKGQIAVEFCTQTRLKSGALRDNFQVRVSHKHGADSYAGVSGGERRRIDLPVAQALQDLVARRTRRSLKIALYDEPVESLDETGLGGVVAFLKAVAEERDTVFVVTHLPALQGRFPTEIKVVKEGGFSRIEQ